MFPARLQSNRDQYRVQAGLFSCLVLILLHVRCSDSPACAGKDRQAVSPDHNSEIRLSVDALQKAVLYLDRRSSDKEMPQMTPHPNGAGCRGQAAAWS